VLRAAVVALLLIAGAAGAGAARQDSLAAARDLYTSAEYEESLAMLTRLRAATREAADAQAIDQYRAFALFALGRTAEAELVVEAMTAADPAWTLPPSEAPPRLVTLFAQARERALPAAVRTRLNGARALYAEKRFAEAAEAFTAVVMLLGDRDVARVVGDDAPSMMALATGFRDLSLAADEQARSAAGRQAAATPAATAPEGPAAPLPAPADPPADPAGTAPAGTEPASPASGAEPSSAAGAADDGTAVAEPAPAPPAADIVPPVAIAQAIPRPNDVAIPLGSAQVILLELVIDETGRVEKAEVRQSVNRIYEGQLIAATRGWRYRPATQAGRPVKYARTLEVTLNPRKE
jgi:hypothetical protein